MIVSHFNSTARKSSSSHTFFAARLTGVAVYDVNTGELLRLVSKPQGDGIPSSYTHRLQLLDVIEIEDLGACPLEHQTENILVDLNWGLRKISHIDSFDLLEQLANSYTPIFGDTNYKLLTANGLNHSLEIVKFSAMSFTQNENNRTKASFRANARWHNYYSVTDVLQLYRAKPADPQTHIEMLKGP